jgi:hypothetical protein
MIYTIQNHATQSHLQARLDLAGMIAANVSRRKRLARNAKAAVLFLTGFTGLDDCYREAVLHGETISISVN